MFKAIGRYLRALGYLLTVRVDKATEATQYQSGGNLRQTTIESSKKSESGSISTKMPSAP